MIQLLARYPVLVSPVTLGLVAAVAASVLLDVENADGIIDHR